MDKGILGNFKVREESWKEVSEFCTGENHLLKVMMDMGSVFSGPKGVLTVLEDHVFDAFGTQYNNRVVLIETENGGDYWLPLKEWEVVKGGLNLDLHFGYFQGSDLGPYKLVIYEKLKTS